MDLRPTVLTGRVVRLEPLGLRHVADLADAAAFDEIWTHLDTPTPDGPAATADLVAAALDEQRRGTRLPFAVVDLGTGRAVGSTSYLDVRPRDRGVEIGWSWLTPALWRTGANTDAKLLLMRHAFEEQGAVRVAFKTDQRNTRSQRALERLGAVREGVWRNHRVRRDGSLRHSVYYSVLDTEWPAVRDRLS